MNKCNYLDIEDEIGNASNTLDRSSLDAEKKDEIALPEFVKELPKKKKVRQNNEFTAVEYEWKDAVSDSMKVKSIEFRKEEKLEDLYRINKNDGTDSFTLKHNNRIYVLRKTTKNVALALMNLHGKLKGIVENVIGWLKTLSGNIYAMAKVEKGSWTFDNTLANGPEIQAVSAEQLGDAHKERLCEGVVERMVELQKKGLILRNFSTSNVWLNGNSLVFADLRNLKLAKKKSVLAEEFKKALSYLYNAGIATRADVFASVAYYIATMEEHCADWYCEKTGKQAEPLEIALEIENAVYN